MQRTFQLLFLCLPWLLVGCASSTAQQSLAAAFRGSLAKLGPSVDNAVLSPAYRYLRVDLDGSAPALLVLGYVDPAVGGPVEVWYSSVGEVLKTQHGRIVGTVGLPTDWTTVRYVTPPVAWTALRGKASTYERVRNVLPMYRFGIKENVAIAPVSLAAAERLPSKLFVGGLQKADAAKYRWYQEQASGVVAPNLPVSWFALGMREGSEMVVFSRQCLTVDLCMNLQLWPVQQVAFNP